MRKQFVRLFLGFVLVVAVVLGIQAAVFLLSVQNQRKAWTESIFQEYLSSFTTNMRKNISLSSHTLLSIEDVLLSSADDRVSGLYIRNPDGAVVVAYGNTSNGNALPVPRMRPPEQMRDMHEGGPLPLAQEEVGEQEFTSSEMQSDVYVVKIIQNGPMASLMVTKQPEPQKKTILLPSRVKATDIAGSMVLMYNNEVLGSVDVLTYTPFTYKDTGRLFKGLLYPFLFSMPFAFLIALLMAASISRKSQRYTQGIEKALSTLSRGENGVELPSTKIDEQRVINSSIQMLDEHLLMHKRSRQAWLQSISHDLNTPVTSMKLLLDGMSDGVFPMDKQTITSLQKEHGTLSDRVAAVVLYANLQSPEAKAEMKSITVPSLVEQVLSHFTEEQRNRIYIDAGQAGLVGDQKLLVLACRELLANGLKAGEDSVGWAISMNAMTFTNAGTLSEGVDFFEPWARGDSGRSTPGSGLGLPIVNQVMLLHKGTATIEQRDGQVVVSLRW